MSSILKGLQLNELSNKKLGDYKTAAGADATAADKAGDYKRGDKRMSGIIKATKKEFDNDKKKKDVAEAGMPFRGVGGAFNRGDDERHDLDPTEWYIVKDGKMFKTSVYPNQVQLAIAQGYSRSREEAKAKADRQGVTEGSDNQEIGQQMANDGVTYSPAKENEIINLMAQYMQKAGMSSKQIRYLLSYDEDYVGDQLSFLPRQEVTEDQLDELSCWSGYHRVAGTKAGFPGSCAKNKTNEEGVVEEQHSCPHCGGEMVSEELMNEKKDACYYKVKSRYKVWPSAYASGALVKCRKSGADNWGTGGKKNESSILEGIEQVDENLNKWFKEKWVRFGPDGKIRGDCARGDDSEGKPKCLPQSKAQNLGKEGRASAAARKRREDPNPERSGKAINVNTKKKSNEGVAEGSDDNKPFDYEKWKASKVKPRKPRGYKDAEALGKAIDSEQSELRKREQGVEEAYQFKGPFPFDVDHMHGGRGINLPSAPTKKFFTDKKQWLQTVNDINSSKYDDNSDYIGVTGRSTVEINGREWARWSDAQQKGYIELSSMSEQGVAEGSLDDIEDTKQFRDAVALAKTQKAIRQAKYGKDTKFYADGTPHTPKEVARRAAERKARQQGVAEMDKSQTPPGRDGSNDPDAGKKEYTAKAITPEKIAKHGKEILNKVLNKKQGVAEDQLDEKWSTKYKDSINCSNPKGFSQRAHCQGKNK